MPADLGNKFSIMTVSKRENPCDAFISKNYKKLKDLPRNATIGTSSPRRIAMLKNISKDFKIVEIRGNIQTRLKKMSEQNIDGIILAAAGLHRMKLRKSIAEYIPIDSFIPSAGQGILCIEYLKKKKKEEKLLNKYNVINLICIASLGNILGSILNWYLGFHFVKFKEKKWFPINKRQLEKASLWFLNYGKWSLFLSWVPFVGDPLTVVAGVLRVPIITFLIIVSISKILRYVIVSLIALNLF